MFLDYEDSPRETCSVCSVLFCSVLTWILFDESRRDIKDERALFAMF